MILEYYFRPLSFQVLKYVWLHTEELFRKLSVLKTGCQSSAEGELVESIGSWQKTRYRMKGRREKGKEKRREGGKKREEYR